MMNKKTIIKVVVIYYFIVLLLVNFSYAWKSEDVRVVHQYITKEAELK